MLPWPPLPDLTLSVLSSVCHLSCLWWLFFPVQSYMSKKYPDVHPSCPWYPQYSAVTPHFINCPLISLMRGPGLTSIRKSWTTQDFKWWYRATYPCAKPKQIYIFTWLESHACTFSPKESFKFQHTSHINACTVHASYSYCLFFCNEAELQVKIILW